jgi:hypothetical protein
LGLRPVSRQAVVSRQAARYADPARNPAALSRIRTVVATVVAVVVLGTPGCAGGDPISRSIAASVNARPGARVALADYTAFAWDTTNQRARTRDSDRATNQFDRGLGDRASVLTVNKCAVRWGERLRSVGAWADSSPADS